MSETTGSTNKFNSKGNKSEKLFDKKSSLTEQQQQQQQPTPPHSLPRVYMIKVVDKKEQHQQQEEQLKENHSQEFNTILLGGNYNNNNNYSKKMKSKQPNSNNNSIVIEDMDDSAPASQLNTSRTVPLPKSLPIVVQQLPMPSKKLNNSHSFLNASIGSVGGGSGVTSSLVSLSNNNFSKENSVVQVNEKLLNRGIQTDHHGNGLIAADDQNLVNKSGSNILLLSMSHSSSLNSSRADLTGKQNIKFK